MLTVGLTGGIAAGKSTVSGFLKAAGAVIIDADKIAYNVVKKGSPAWQGIVSHFSKKILLPDGGINREHLGNIIFNNPDEKEKLNSIVHPFVFQEMEKQIRLVREKSPGEVVIQDIPLLMESDMHKSFSCVIVVYIPESLQIKRLMERNNLSREDAVARIRSQMPIEEKKKLGDIIIDNSGALEKTRKQVIEVYHMLKHQAESRNPLA